jgi:hypothetical protein
MPDSGLVAEETDERRATDEAAVSDPDRGSTITPPTAMVSSRRPSDAESRLSCVRTSGSREDQVDPASPRPAKTA